MNVDNGSERYYATFVLRVWVNLQVREQRFRLEDLRSGDGLVFHDASELADYLHNGLLPPAAPLSPPTRSF